MTITRAITHSGAFHADDVLAFTVLSELFDLSDLVRTRDEDIIANAGTDTIVFDVGNEYDPERLRFDHHQIRKPLRDEGLAYSSFGLIWKHFGLQYLTKCSGLSEEDAEVIHRRLDGRIVRDIDAIDNGTPMPDQVGVNHPMGLAAMIVEFRPDFDEDSPHAMNDAFYKAAHFARDTLKRKIQKAAASLRADKVVTQAIENREQPEYIELPRGMSYQGAILKAEADDILYVVHPADGDWLINAVNVDRGAYEMRQPLPEEWAGLRGQELAAVTGVEDAVFCHTGRFIAGARSREGVMRMLEKALEAKPANALSA
jgi:uncharacterized UPF0160 family protein